MGIDFIISVTSFRFNLIIYRLIYDDLAEQLMQYTDFSVELREMIGVVFATTII